MTGDEFARLLIDFTLSEVFKRWTGWLKERSETTDYLARPTGSRAKTEA
jgi:hypothetical protein